MIPRLATAALAAATFVLSTAGTHAQVASTAPAPPLIRPTSPTLGPANARVHLVEVLDPACEGCRAFAPVVKQILDEHPGRVRLWVRYAPFHRGSDFVVKALEAVRLQDRFWPALDALFAKQDQWTRGHAALPDQVLAVLGGVPGIDLARLKRDMERPEIAKALEQDIADAKALKLTQTPTFYINGKLLEPFGVEPLRAQVRAAVAAQYR